LGTVLDAVRTGESLVALTNRGHETLAAETIGAGAERLIARRIAVDVGAAAGAINRLVRSAIQALGRYGRLLLVIDELPGAVLRAHDLGCASRNAAATGCRIPSLLGRLPVGARHAAPEMVHEAQARAALEALGFDVDFFFVEAQEVRVVFLLWSAGI